MNKYKSKLAKTIGKLNGYKQFAITINQTTYYSVTKEKVNDRWKRHEDKHKEQYKEDGIVKFLCKYLYEYLKCRIKGLNHNQAYLNISYEIEAREAECLLI